MNNNIKNDATGFMGKVKEKAGRILDDEGLELKGKLQSIQSNISDKVEGVKEDVMEKANDLIDDIKRRK